MFCPLNSRIYGTTMSNNKFFLSVVASFAPSAMLIKSVLVRVRTERTITNEFISQEVLDIFHSGFHNLSPKFSTRLTVVIEEFQGMSRNLVFEAVEGYPPKPLSHLKSVRIDGLNKRGVNCF